MTHHYPDLGSDVLQYGISELVSQTSFGGETSGSIAKCRLFSQATARSVFCFLKSKKWPFNHSSDMSHFIISVFVDTLIILHYNIARKFA